MSEGPELSEIEILAAEHVLGLLDVPERAAAEARASRDAGFAALVEAWRNRLAPLMDTVQDVAPPARVWPRIERMLPANDNAAFERTLRFWRGATGMSLGVAAASIAAASVMLSARPPQVAPPIEPGQLLNASLTTQGSAPQPLFVAAYDPVRKALIVTSLVHPGTDPAHVHQLWVIPADGKPRSLGTIEPGKSKSIPMAPSLVPMLAEGSAIAVSVEPPGGSPKADGPSGPIAAVGKLSKI